MEVKLYDIGEGMSEGDVLNYFVKEGDFVDVDQPIVELQTEKMVTELTAPTKGVVKEILVQPGQTIPVGTTILTIESDDIQKEKIVDNQFELENDISTKKATNKMKFKGPKRIKAAPYTRKIARELHVDIEMIQGTGKDGRVTVEDVRRYAENNVLEPQSDRNNLNQESSNEVVQGKHYQEEGQFDYIPFKGRRKQIAKNMVKSVYTIPHVHHMEEIDMTELLQMKEDLKQEVNISVAAFFIKALTIALKDYPIFNAQLEEEKERIKLNKKVHMGMAVDTADGLIVPVIKNADEKSIVDIHNEMKELIKKAQENKVTLQEITGSTFTISNVGPMGSIGATPIINYPEVALMAFHKTKKMPVVNDKDEIVIRSIMNVTLSFDHRVEDGAGAIAFTNRFKALIENPKLFIVALR